MRNQYIHTYRSPKTTSERKANQDGWCRSKRSYKNLPNTYDDQQTVVTKSWKDYRRKQYYIDGRGTKHIIIVSPEIHEYNLEQYFKQHNIPYNIQHIYKNNTYIYYHIKTKIIWWTNKDINITQILESLCSVK